jgi:hypothetical protein
MKFIYKKRGINIVKCESARNVKSENTTHIYFNIENDDNFDDEY